MAASSPPPPQGPEESGIRRPARRRLDALLVERGLAPSRAKAQALILAGQVLVNGVPVGKPGSLYATDSALALRQTGSTYVSRGGEKLAGALRDFGVNPEGRRVLDLGASTGGFTDCLLRHGARQVVAVDVGHGQLAWELRQDPRVEVRERTNARLLRAADFDLPFDLATVDLSFISVRLVLPVLAALLTPAAEALILVKPQFEVGKGEVGKGGVVRHPAQHETVLRRVAAAAAEAGFHLRRVALSCLRGPKGNREFFLHLARRPAPGPSPADILEAFLARFLSPGIEPPGGKQHPAPPGTAAD
ncbi:MAG: TlyA family RNA methyltransferase [Candidatus Tectomicrobia bacterium]|nr:TlyA family RNA methyltransferase [Candidatus Tectomicrobia bacterium]